MSAVELAAVLRMRALGEVDRMADLSRLLPYAATGDAASRRPDLATRISARAAWAANLPDDDAGWADLRDQGRGADLLIDELMALVVTRLLRDQGLDRGTFDAAEALLLELSALAGVPRLILGQSQEMESVNHPRASVALRFPGTRAWDLPFLVHEFGHHAVAQLRHIEPEFPDKRPLEEVVDRTATARAADGETAELAWDRAHELVADVFATTVGGPSYPLACLTLRVPLGTEAFTARNKHPAWSERIAAMRTCLDVLSDRTGQARYRSQRVEVIDPLARSILGRLPAETAASDQAADGTVAAIRRHRPGLVFGGADEGIAVAAALRAGQHRRPEQAGVLAILDGAWRWRLRRTDAAADPAAASLVAEYCRSLLPGGPDGPRL